MNRIDDRQSPDGARLPATAPHTFWHAARQFVFGVFGLTVITFVALRLNLQPGATSFFI